MKLVFRNAAAKPLAQGGAAPHSTPIPVEQELLRLQAENAYLKYTKHVQTGNCLDNAVMENFFGHPKAEMLYTRNISSVGQLAHEVHTYMNFYSHERYQKKLRDMAPVEYRNYITQPA